MANKDKEKTTFVTSWGTFCYKVMPFGLKNVRATYQRAMMTLFHDMMHKKIAVYVDVMRISPTPSVIMPTTHWRCQLGQSEELGQRSLKKH
jgi:hypothetical protein